MKTSLKYSI